LDSEEVAFRVKEAVLQAAAGEKAEFQVGAGRELDLEEQDLTEHQNFAPAVVTVLNLR
jgi:hypothetical protein